jgi:hypothetical protein
MKKETLLLLSGIIGIIALSTSYYFFNQMFNFTKAHFYVFVTVQLILLCTTVVYFVKWYETTKGIPSEDEMSKEVYKKAAQSLFPYSISIWVFILFCSVDSLESVVRISIGIAGMGVLYLMFWIYYKVKGTHLND